VEEALELTGKAEEHHFWFRGFRRFLAPVITDRAAGRRDLRLIDCGCGTGANLTLLVPHGRAFGFDLTEYGSARASTRKGASVVRADILRIPFASGAFDMATSFDVLQCVPGDVEAVSEMARVVRPGGLVILTLAAHEFLRGDHAETWNEVRRYTPETARALMARAGLRVERVSFLFASIFPLFLVARTWQRLLRRYRRPRPDGDISVPPEPLNAVLTWLLNGEAMLARRVSMPIGSSLLVVGVKDQGSS
jgi:SAM-dependent methyltransferase